MLLEWFWLWNKSKPLAVDRLLQQHYEFDLAVAFISKRVAEQIRQLSQQLAGQLAPAIFEVCAVWYADLSREMFQRLQAQEDEHPELFQAIQQHVVRQAVQASAQEKLDKLLSDGIVSGAIAEKLAEGFEFE